MILLSRFNPPLKKVRLTLYHAEKYNARKIFPLKDLFFSPDYTSLGQIIGRHFQSNFIPGINSYVVLSELTADVSNNLVAVFELHPELSSGKFLCNNTFDFNNI